MLADQVCLSLRGIHLGLEIVELFRCGCIAFQEVFDPAFFAFEGGELLVDRGSLFFKYGQLRSDSRTFGSNGFDGGQELFAFQLYLNRVDHACFFTCFQLLAFFNGKAQDFTGCFSADDAFFGFEIAVCIRFPGCFLAGG